MRNESIVCNTFLLKNEDSQDKEDLFLPIIHYEMLLRVFLIRCWCGKTFFSQDRQPLVFALNFGLEEHQLSEFKGQWVVTCTIWFDESGITRNKTVKPCRCRNQSNVQFLCHARDISFLSLKKRWIFCPILIAFLRKLNSKQVLAWKMSNTLLLQYTYSKP